MSDIITNAKWLLEDATPGPWELINGEIYQIQHTPEQCTSLRCDHRWHVLSENWGENPAVAAEDADIALMAASREMAQAIAEETWEYSAQAKRGESWETSTNSETHLEEWWQDKTDAEEAAARMQEQGHTTRIVERRVSPPQITQ